MSDEKKQRKYAANRKYDQEHTKVYTIKVVDTTERDIICKLDSVPNKAGYIKKLIRQDIQKDH